jgi:long-chain alkane monooxygenase
LYQAGSSDRGKHFAATHAEAVFIGAPTAPIARGHVSDLRRRAAAAGRDPYDIKAFCGYTVITAETEREAHRKHDLYRGLVDPEGMLALWSGWLGFDLSGYGLSDTLRMVPNDAIQSAAETFGQGDWTVGDLVYRLGLGADGPVAVGTPTEVADSIQEWLDETDADGLNLGHVVTPGSYADFVELVVPELQRRGVYRKAHEPGTLRHQLFGRGDRLPVTHRADRYRDLKAASASALT